MKCTCGLCLTSLCEEQQSDRNPLTVDHILMELDIRLVMYGRTLQEEQDPKKIDWLVAMVTAIQSFKQWVEARKETGK